MKIDENKKSPVRVSTARPSAGQVAAAKLLIKRSEEGKSKVTITPRITHLASFSD